MKRSADHVSTDIVASQTANARVLLKGLGQLLVHTEGVSISLCRREFNFLAQQSCCGGDDFSKLFFVLQSKRKAAAVFGQDGRGRFGDVGQVRRDHLFRMRSTQQPTKKPSAAVHAIR